MSSANNAPIAVVTGITGQDGAYLSELLLSKGYTVYGTYRRTSSVNFWRIEELGIQDHPALHLVEYDLTDLSSSIRLLQTSGATEVYNLAAQSFVGVSFDQPITTGQITGLGAAYLLEAIRTVNRDPGVRAAFMQDAASVADRYELTEAERAARGLADHMAEVSRHGVFGDLVATFCATSATAS